MKNQFLSTPSARRATQLHALGAEVVVISIHALREEGDSKNSSPSPGTANFYPRPPRGGRPLLVGRKASASNFYPRPPRGGRPSRPDAASVAGSFLSTPSARRATNNARDDAPVWEFLSTPSARRATAFEVWQANRKKISIHALREEGDSKNRDKISIFKQIIQHSARI